MSKTLNSRQTMQIRACIIKQLIRFLTLSFAGLLFLLICPARALCNNAEPSNNSPQTDTYEKENSTHLKRPRFISVTLKNPSEALITGEPGFIELDARINKTEKHKIEEMFWNKNLENPLTIWLSAPPESGIKFFDRNTRDKGFHKITLKCKAGENPDPELIKIKVKYLAAPDTKTGNHSFELNISADLLDSSQNLINDSGTLMLDFEVDTPLITKLIMLAVVAVVILFFIMEWVRVDVAAILVMVLLPLSGLLDSGETFRGLSSNAVIAIIGVMIISYGLNRTGLVNRAIEPLLNFVDKSPKRLVVTFSSIIAFLSGIMQNTGAAVLFLPAIKFIASRRLKIHISGVLMPIGMAAILGGTLTIIGTSPLILLNDILPEGMEKIGFLELTPIGSALVIGGIAYLSTAGISLLKKNTAQYNSSEKTDKMITLDINIHPYPDLKGPYEINIPADYQPGSREQKIRRITDKYRINVVAIGRSQNSIEEAPPHKTLLASGMSLCVYGEERLIRSFCDDYGLILLSEPQIFKNSMFNPSVSAVVEGILSPFSVMIDKTMKDIKFREAHDISALALHRNCETYYKDFDKVPLKAGDKLLLHGTLKKLKEFNDFDRNFVFITPFEKDFPEPQKAGRALACFFISLIMMMVSTFHFSKLDYNPIPLSVCLMTGALGMILSGVIKINEAYRTIDWRTVFLLGGLIPLGIAIEQTGTARWIAKGIILAVGSHMSAPLLLILLAVLSCGFTMVISNVGACALLVPLSISLANQAGVDPRTAAIVVGIGVSNSFILPTHQVNALYMGAGGYSAKDYIKVGWGLSLIYIVILFAMSYLFYL